MFNPESIFRDDLECRCHWLILYSSTDCLAALDGVGVDEEFEYLSEMFNQNLFLEMI
jgi:hypothetical protein